MKLAILRGNNRETLSPSLYNAVKMKDLLLEQYFSNTDIEIVRVFLDDYNASKKAFTVYWKFKDEDFIVKQHAIQPDIIRNMCPLYSYYVHNLLSGYPIICSRHVALLCDDKYTTYQFLGARQPYTVLLQDFLNHASIRDNFGDSVITKPIYGSKGQGVMVYTKEGLLKQKDALHTFGKTIIVQQGIDVSGGYKDLIKRRHDLRVYMSGTSIVDALIRQQKPGLNDFRVSVALGGKAIPLNKEDIPQELEDIIHAMVPILAPQSYDFYSLDFMFDSNEEKWYLIEANSAPGFRNERKIHDIKQSVILNGIETCIRSI